VRRLIVAVVIALSSSGIFASEPATVESLAADLAAQEMAVTVTPIPMPPPVVEMLKDVNTAPVLKAAKKIKVAKKKSLPTILLSRTERHQMVLLAARPNNPSLIDFFNDEDAAPGVADLDLHRSFSRPKLIEVADQDQEDENPGLSDAVKLRLFLARMKAVQAHEKKFS